MNVGTKPTIIQKYDSVYLEPLNPDYEAVARKSQQLFSSNGEDMHEKACGPAEDNTDFSKEEFVIETEGLGDIYQGPITISQGMGLERNDLVDIYSKKSEVKPLLHAEKGRS